jgi:Amt family ammonium transporter
MSSTENDAFRPRILLAEDNPDHQKVISVMLRKVRADVTIVENGQSAVRCALQAQEEGNAFDLILMDIRMPVMDGCLATRQLREAGYRLPIVAMTAHAMAGDREEFIAAGCNDYISKPIDVSALLNLVKSWADGSRRAGSGKAGFDGPIPTIRAAERQG